MLSIHWAWWLNVQCVPSLDIVLTDKHMSILEKWGGRFWAANPDHWEEIVKEAADQIKNAWQEDVEFDRGMVISVCAILSSSQLDWADLICFSRLFTNVCMAKVNGDQRRPLLNSGSGCTLMSWLSCAAKKYTNWHLSCRKMCQDCLSTSTTTIELAVRLRGIWLTTSAKSTRQWQRSGPRHNCLQICSSSMSMAIILPD